MNGIIEKQLKSISCKSCDKNFAHPNSLKTHIKTIHEGIIFKCDSCEKIYSLKQSLKIHKESVHEKIRFDCDLCEKSFTQKRLLKRHLMSCIQQKGTANDDENETEKDEFDEDMTDHANLGIKIKTESNQMETDHQKEDLDENDVHDQDENLEQDENYEFDNFKMEEETSGHQEMIENDQDESDDVTIKNKMKSKSTSKVHRKSKLFKCCFCDKTFSQSNNVNRHVSLVHEKQKSYKCETCEKSFSTNQNLKVHNVRVHSQPTKSVLEDVHDHNEIKQDENKESVNFEMEEELSDQDMNENDQNEA